MSQPPAPYPSRSAYSTKLPDRSGSSAQYNNPGVQPTQPAFGQSAPAFGRRFEGEQVPTYSAYPQYAPAAAFGAGRGQTQAIGTGTGKESSSLNDLSDEQRDEINEAFTIFDLDKDRHLDFHELRVALRALGFNPHKSEILQLMSVNGVPKANAHRLAVSGRNPSYHPSQLLIPQAAFTVIAGQKIIERDPREEVERAFYLFDVDRKDYINLEDLKRVTRELGETSLEEQELAAMIEEFDYEDRRGISKDTFYSICLQ